MQTKTLQLRTLLVTAVSLLGILLLAGTAVGANLGILQSADRSPVGHLTIADLGAPPNRSGAAPTEARTDSNSATAAAEATTTITVPSAAASTASDSAASTTGTVPLGSTPTSLSVGQRPVEPSDDHEDEDDHDEEGDSEHDDYDDD